MTVTTVCFCDLLLLVRVFADHLVTGKLLFPVVGAQIGCLSSACTSAFPELKK
jgi:hypothetical protein